MTFRSKTRQFVTQLHTQGFAAVLCMLLLFGQSATPWMSHTALSQLSHSLPEDIELLCTGSDIKFYSVSQSAAAGKLVYVDGPDKTSSTADFWCQLGIAIVDDSDALLASSLAYHMPRGTHRVHLVGSSADFAQPITYAGSPRSPPHSLALI